MMMGTVVLETVVVVVVVVVAVVVAEVVSGAAPLDYSTGMLLALLLEVMSVSS